MTNHQFTEIPDWFEMREVGEGIYCIRERYYREDYRCNIYVVKGRKHDLVIDTGLGLGSLRKFIAPVLNKPILICSHGHYDHIGGNFEFSERLMHPAELEIVAYPTHQNTYADLLLSTEDFQVLPWNGFEAKDWVIEPAPATGFLVEGDLLDLGNRRFQVLHTPGHAWGSICLWEECTGVFFCADTVYEGEIFDALSCSHIPTYITTMQRLRNHPVHVAYPGHGPILTADYFRTAVNTYLSKYE
jgi:glyoxylase-like metal-dependent hydrolase (beta-lactamase superfamily II)